MKAGLKVAACVVIWLAGYLTIFAVGFFYGKMSGRLDAGFESIKEQRTILSRLSKNSPMPSIGEKPHTFECHFSTLCGACGHIEVGTHKVICDPSNHK